MSIDNEWMQFKDEINLSGGNISTQNKNNKKKIIENMPKCSEIYISTQTKIAYLNQKIDLNTLYWSIPVIDYFSLKMVS